MAHKEQGFLHQLGLDNQAPRFNSVSGGGRAAAAANIVRSAGRGPLTTLLAGAAGGVAGLRKGAEGGRSFREFGRDFQQGVTDFQEGNQARDRGITVAQLRSKNRLREAASKIKLDSGSIADQIKTLDRVILAANAAGEIDAALQAAEMRNQLEKQAIAQEQAGLDVELGEQTLELKGLVDAFDAEGKEVTGTLETRSGIAGLRFADETGAIQWKAFGEDLFREDPNDGRSGESIDVRLSRITSTSERAAIRTMVSGNALSLKKFDRVMTTIKKLHEAGAIEAVLSSAGTITTKIDQITRAIRGVSTAFFGPGSGKDKGVGSGEFSCSFNAKGEQRCQNILAKTQEWAQDSSSEIWDSIKLPDFALASSAAAQNFRANILDLAYMAARLREPSNRGLSDNDIKLALTSIAGDSANPQFILRRFAEMMGDSAYELDTRLLNFHGALTGVSDDEIDRVLAGKGLIEYRIKYKELFDKHNITINDSGEAVFETLIDADIQDLVPAGDDPSVARDEDDLARFLINEEALLNAVDAIGDI